MKPKCIFCSNEDYKNNMCENHYKKMIQLKNDFILQNKSEYDYKNHYHNLRHSIYRQYNINHVIDSLIRLISLSEAYKNVYKNSYFVEQVYNFSTKILSDKTKIIIENNKEIEKYRSISNYDFDFRNFWPCNFRCEDGHMVRSESEMIIDNWLFYHDISHAYEKRIMLNIRNYLICDFYLPQYNAYIEYWGLYGKKYLSRKAAKKELYRENNITLIEINYDSMKSINEYLSNAIKSLQSQ